MIVPLSTSSSNSRIQAGSWSKTWTAAALAVLLVLGAWEGFWRYRGFSPSLQDDWPVWATVRRDVTARDDENFVVVGSSRIQVGFHPNVYQQATGRRAFILAIDGSSPIPVLADLAADTGRRIFPGPILRK
jgi:hypothetical protein